MRITFIICSHRAPDSILDTIRSLGRQQRQETAELVLVNNGFSATRASALLEHAATSGLACPFRIVPEPIPGLGYSRRRGFLEAKGEWLVLLDDDNTVEDDFLAQLNRKLDAHPDIGGITALVSPVWEETPPDWLAVFGCNCLSYNVHSTFKNRPLEKHFPSGETERAERPPGGGMVIHRSVAASYLKHADDPLRLSLARTGTSLVGCEDADMWGCIPPLGRSVLVTDALRVHHHIPKSRLDKKYLLRLNYQMAYSYALLERLLNPAPLKPLLPDLGHRLLQTARHLKIGLTRGPLLQHLIEIARDLGNFKGSRKSLPTKNSAESATP
jgi:glycosyltransferase involved in cell wall biosynthesis